MKKNFVQKELAARWECSIKTVRREIRRFQLRPSKWRGLQPIFDAQAVLEMEAKRNLAKLRALGLDDVDDGAAIITIRKAKAIARRGRK